MIDPDSSEASSLVAAAGPSARPGKRRLMTRVAILVAVAAAIGILDASIRPIRLSLDRPAAPDLPGTPGDAGAARRRGMIGLGQARALHADPAVVFVDARYEADFRGGHIAGAWSLPPEAFANGAIPDLVSQVSRDATIVVYCKNSNCDAAVLVTLRLTEFGFGRSVVFEDGYDAWVAAGLPVATGS